MFSDIERKIKKRNSLLFTRDSACLQELLGLIELQKHRTLVMWAFDCAKIPLQRIENQYPNEKRPRIALDACQSWACGEIKMPIAKKAILGSHAVAKETEDKVYAALCHAIGHAGATVHVETHAIGLAFYELTAIVLECGKTNYQAAVSEKINYYQQRLLYWQANIDKQEFTWANFLLDDTRPNKEKALRLEVIKSE